MWRDGRRRLVLERDAPYSLYDTRYPIDGGLTAEHDMSDVAHRESGERFRQLQMQLHVLMNPREPGQFAVQQAINALQRHVPVQFPKAEARARVMRETDGPPVQVTLGLPVDRTLTVPELMPVVPVELDQGIIMEVGYLCRNLIVTEKIEGGRRRSGQNTLPTAESAAQPPVVVHSSA